MLIIIILVLRVFIRVIFCRCTAACPALAAPTTAACHRFTASGGRCVRHYSVHFALFVAYQFVRRGTF